MEQERWLHFFEKLLADDEIVVSDYDEVAAKEVVARLKSPKLIAKKADVFDKARLLELMNEENGFDCLFSINL